MNRIELLVFGSGDLRFNGSTRKLPCYMGVQARKKISEVPLALLRPGTSMLWVDATRCGNLFGVDSQNPRRTPLETYCGCSCRLLRAVLCKTAWQQCSWHPQATGITGMNEETLIEQDRINVSQARHVCC